MVLVDGYMNKKNNRAVKKLLKKHTDKDGDPKRSFEQREDAMKAWMSKTGSTLIFYLERVNDCVWEQNPAASCALACTRSVLTGGCGCGV